MPGQKPLVLLGGGGHCVSCVDVIESSEEWSIVGILETPSKIGHRVSGYPVIGDDNDIDRLVKQDNYFLVTLGQIGSPVHRQRLFHLLEQSGAKLATVVSPKAHVSKRAEIGEGAIIHHGSIVNANVSIGRNCIINTGTIIEHDCRIGNHTHISTRVAVNGGVSVGNGCFIGSGSVLLQGITVVDGVVIGASSLVLGDIKEPGTYKGIYKNQRK